MKIDIMGVEYAVHRVNPYEQIHGGKGLDEQGMGGFCDYDLKEIYVADMSATKGWENEPQLKIKEREKRILRHEITHAFLFESGLNWDSSVLQDGWATNEEMVDWFAIQGEKIYKCWVIAEKLFFGGDGYSLELNEVEVARGAKEYMEKLANTMNRGVING
jgi:hypothetical protein